MRRLRRRPEWIRLKVGDRGRFIGERGETQSSTSGEAFGISSRHSVPGSRVEKPLNFVGLIGVNPNSRKSTNNPINRPFDPILVFATFATACGASFLLRVLLTARLTQLSYRPTNFHSFDSIRSLRSSPWIQWSWTRMSTSTSIMSRKQR